MANKEKAAVKSGAKKAIKVPSKATMNFARRQSRFNYRKMLPIIVMIIAAAILFAKIGIVDQLSKKIDAYSRLSDAQTKVSAASEQLASYNEVAEQYGRYSYGWMSETEVNTVDRMKMLELVEKIIMPKAGIEDISINNNVLTLNLTGITLEQTSNMVKVLEQEELVESAAVYSAAAENAEEASIFISIVLTNSKEAE